MAQFDVYRVPAGYAIDCQSDLMQHFATRLTVPLLRPNDAPKPAARLNPTFTIDGEALVMVTQFAGAVAARSLKDKVASLADHDLEIKSALDMLITGY